MKGLDEQNHYEVLEVPRHASSEQIERAYRLAKATYEEGSLGLYSIFDESDAKSVLGRVEQAYRVLSDAEGRERYDRELFGASAAAEAGEEARPAPERAPAPLPTRPVPEMRPPIADFEDFDPEDDSDDFDGARLRRIRMRRGIELDHVAGITKINPTYLRFIEDESYEDLPAPVYVRGFVAAYARCIGLESTPVASSYMARMEAAKSGGRRTGLLGRR
ncbi:MAG: helix-turn-helix domain-containing protein [Proteobacteria bacterium]|nr:helix-turn-helix domain-containing protein [Pseudomonadota bacterium]